MGDDAAPPVESTTSASRSGSSRGAGAAPWRGGGGLSGPAAMELPALDRRSSESLVPAPAPASAAASPASPPHSPGGAVAATDVSRTSLLRRRGPKGADAAAAAAPGAGGPAPAAGSPSGGRVKALLAAQTLLLCVFLLLPVLAYRAAVVTEEGQNDLLFHAAARRVADVLALQTANTEVAILSLTGYAASTPFADGLAGDVPPSAGSPRAAWSGYVEPVLRALPAVRAMSFTPVVPRARRAEFEAAAAADLGSPEAGVMRDLLPNGTLVPASDDRDEYFPVFLIAPIEENRAAIMFNLGSNAARAEALAEASATGRPVASAPIRLVQSAAPGVLSPFAHLLMSPVAATSNGTRGGFAVGVVQVETMVMSALLALPGEPLRVVVSDAGTGTAVAAAEAAPRAGDSDAGASWRPAAVLGDGAEAWVAEPGGLHFPLVVGQRAWDVHVSRGAGFSPAGSSSAFDALFALSLMSTGFAAVAVTLTYLAGRHVLRHERQQKALARAAHAEAVRANESKSNLLAFLCHELRNPCFAVVATVDLMLEQASGALPPEVLEAVSTVRISSDTMTMLINQLVDLSLIERGDAVTQCRRADAADVLCSVLLAEATRAAGRGVLLAGTAGEPDAAGDRGRLPRAVLCDPSRLQQVLFNLVSNAVRFTGRGGRVDVAAWTRPWREARDAGHVLREPRRPSARDREADSMLAAALDSPSARWLPAALYVRVSDTGEGISADGLARLFGGELDNDPVAVARAGGGTGLGLRVVRSVVRLLGGTVWAESCPGEGSTFSVALPVLADRGAGRLSHSGALFYRSPQERVPAAGGVLAAAGLADGVLVSPVAAAEAAAEVKDGERAAEAAEAARPAALPVSSPRPSSPPPCPAPGPLSGLCLLAADDSLVNRKLIARMLKNTGATLTVVEDGAQAVSALLASGSRYDAVLLDVMMPVMDGVEAARRMRAGGYKGPIVAVTGNALLEDRQVCLAAGMSGVVTKPFKKRTLMAALQSQFGR